MDQSNYHLIRTKKGTFSIVKGSKVCARRRGNILVTDSDTSKLEILLIQLSQFNEWKTVVLRDESLIHQRSASVDLNEVGLNQIEDHESSTRLFASGSLNTIEADVNSDEEFQEPKQHEDSLPTTDGVTEVEIRVDKPEKRKQFEDDINFHPTRSVGLNESISVTPTEESEEDPYHTDEDKDYEYPSSSSSSSDGVDGLDSNSQFQSVRRKLFTVPSEKLSSSSDSTISNSLNKKQKSILLNPPKLMYSASVTISESSLVTLETKVKLHKGINYTCNLCETNGNLLGVLPLFFPHKSHVCDSAPAKASNWTYLLIHRSKFKPLEATVEVVFCTPIGKFQGNELQLFPHQLSTPLMMVNAKEETKSTNKKHCCVYCKKMLVEISKHLIKNHSNEPEVASLMQMKVNSKERNISLKNLRLKGDDIYNQSVERRHRIPVRHSDVTEVENYINCLNCSALIAPTNFARHEKMCSGRTSRKQAIAESRELDLTSRLPTDPSLRDMLMEELLHAMRDDTETHVIMSDSCLQLLAERYAFMHRGNPTALKNDRQHLRRLARLLMEIRDEDPTIIDFQDCIINASYDSLLEGIYKMCDLDEASGEFRKPALAQVLRSAVTVLIKCLSNSFLGKRLFKDSVECKSVDRFLTLHDENYGVYIGRSATRTRLHQKAKRQIPLPDPKDIKLFSTYIATEAQNAYKKLKQHGFSYTTWLRLGQAELTRIIVFNRRRVSEVALMSLELYGKRTTLDDSKKKTLTVLEKALAENFCVMTLVAKRARILNILLDQEQCKHLDLFIHYRSTAGVSSSSDYLFGVPTRVMYIDASNAIRKFSVECGADKPHLLRATYLRKHVATMSQLLALNDNQIAQVARFMGHSKEVHNIFYRQDEKLFQMTSWAKFLMLVDDENINKYRGKTLEEIVNLMEDVPLEEDDLNMENHVKAAEILNGEIRVAELDETVTDILDESSKSGFSVNEIAVDDEKQQTCIKKKRLVNLEGEGSDDVTEKESSLTQIVNNTSKTLSSRRKEVTPKKKTIEQVIKELKTSPRRCLLKKKPFTPEEVKLMTLKFGHYINMGSLAPQAECQDLVEQYPSIFKGRGGRDLYNWVQYRRNKKRQQKLSSNA